MQQREYDVICRNSRIRQIFVNFQRTPQFYNKHVVMTSYVAILGYAEFL